MTGQVPRTTIGTCGCFAAGAGSGRPGRGRNGFGRGRGRIPGPGSRWSAANLDDVVKVMVEGPGGLAAAARSGEEARWVASRRRVDFSTGARAFAYSAERPEKLRGPEHDFAWCDELAKWAKGDSDLGQSHARACGGASGRGRSSRRLRGRSLCFGGSGGWPAFARRSGGRRTTGIWPRRSRRRPMRPMAGPRLGRQELDAELFEDVAGRAVDPGADRECRTRRRAGRIGGSWSGSIRRLRWTGIACGIVVCALRADGIAEVVADHTVGGLSPEGWALKAAAAARGLGRSPGGGGEEQWRADGARACCGGRTSSLPVQAGPCRRRQVGPGGAGGGPVRGGTGEAGGDVSRSSRTSCAPWCWAGAMRGRGARTGPTRWSGR